MRKKLIIIISILIGIIDGLLVAFPSITETFFFEFTADGYFLAMLLATLAPVKPILTWCILLGFFVVMNVILFRKQIFKNM